MSNPNGRKPDENQAVQATGLPGVKRIWRAFFYSLAGLADGYRHEAAFRQEVWLAVVLAPAAFLLPLTPVFRVLTLMCIGLVMAAELLNSAIEALTDKVMPEFDQVAKKAKDMGSAAVLLMLVNLGVVWLFALFSMG